MKRYNLQLEQAIESILLNIYSIMPSLGAYPFTMMSVARAELSGLPIGSVLLSDTQLIVLKRTDFGESDLMDYVVNAKEYGNIPSDKREAFLDSYRRIAEDEASMTEWSERIINIGMGIVMQLARSNGICFKPVEADLSGLDVHFGFYSRNLQAYALFDVNSIITE